MPIRQLFALAVLTCHPVLSLSQVTALDLRQDGRILAGSRVAFLMDQVTQYPSKKASGEGSPALRGLSPSFVQTLASHSKQLHALIVPESKTGGSYKVGLVLGSRTLPQDLELDEEDFKWLRAYSIDQTYAAIDEQVQRVLFTSAYAPPFQANSEVDALRKLSGSGVSMGSLYAGYMLTRAQQDSDTGKPYADITALYRATAERTALSYLASSERKVSVTEPIQFTALRADQTLLSSEQFWTKATTTPEKFAIRQATPYTPAAASYWDGSKLIIIPINIESMADIKGSEDFRKYLQANPPKSLELLKSSDLVMQR